MARNPEQIAADWAAKLGQSTQKITEGVQSVTVAPGQAAARQKQVWATNTAASVDKWARNTASVTLQDWQSAMIDKGTQRIASGATAAAPKFAQFMSQLLPHIDSVVRTLPPRGGLEANITRSAQFARGMAKFQAR